MTTLIKECVRHTPHTEAISNFSNFFIAYQFTFCEECEQNIERFDIDNIKWSKWSVRN